MMIIVLNSEGCNKTPKTVLLVWEGGGDALKLGNQ